MEKVIIMLVTAKYAELEAKKFKNHQKGSIEYRNYESIINEFNSGEHKGLYGYAYSILK